MSRSTKTNYAGKASRYKRSGGYGEYYIDGNTARRLDVREEIKKNPRPIENPDVQRKHHEKYVRMNLGYVLFLVAALAFSAMVLIDYINIQADNKAIMESISQKQSQLNALKMSNDEEYSRIISAVDLAYVKDVAINELGMQYAQEGQIITVEAQGDDYVRQYERMP